MRLLALIAALCAVAAAQAPRVSFTKSFPGSVPAYVSIDVDQDGSAVYKEAPNDEYPLKFKLDAEDAAAIFQLADKLGRFTREIESGLKVANMGLKTFRWTEGDRKNEVKFNYSLDEDAKALADWFERISETEQGFVRLERAVKYDKLGVHQSLLSFEVSWDKKRICAPEQFLPLLDRVAKNDTYLHMARERAAHLADVIRARKAPKAE